MVARRSIPPLSIVGLILDRLVGLWWLFVGFCLLPFSLALFEPVPLMWDAVLALGGPAEDAIVVDVEMTDGSVNSVPIWRSEVALVRDASVRRSGYSTGMVYAVGDSARVQCTLVSCEVFRIAQTRSTQLGLGWNLVLGVLAFWLGANPIRTLWRRRWWLVALRRGVATRGWLGEDRKSHEGVQRLAVHYDDSRGDRWQRRCWLGYRKRGYSTESLTVLYVEDDPQKSVVLEELPDWMGKEVPRMGDRWPGPDIAAWLRIGGGLGVVVTAVWFFRRLVG